MNSSEGVGYSSHLWGREIGSVLNIPLLCLSSAGQYRVNFALFQDQPSHPVFSNGALRSWYEAKKGLSRIIQACFVPQRWRNKSEPCETGQMLRRSGSGLQAVAGYGLQIPSLFRLGMNSRILLDPVFWHSKSESTAQRFAIVADTLSLGSGLAQIHFYNRALRCLYQGEEAMASRYFIQNHRLHLGSSVFQMTAGLTRLILELEKYSETGEFRPSSAFFGALDSAAGAVGIIYSRYLLVESSRTVQIDSRNNLLMGLTPLPSRLRWGLRGLGFAGSVMGVGLSLCAFASTIADKNLSQEIKQNKLIASGLSIFSSMLMTGATLFGQSAVTAPFAGLFMVGSLVMVIGQVPFR